MKRVQLLSQGMRFVLFNDVLSTLKTLKEQNLTLGLLTNLDRDMKPLYSELGLEPYIDFFVTSGEVGVDKPKPPIFLMALQRAGVKAPEAIHVGDQYHADVLGARGAGIKPLLLDRHDFALSLIRIAKAVGVIQHLIFEQMRLVSLGVLIPGRATHLVDRDFLITTFRQNLVLNLPAIGLWVQVLRIPYPFLFPLILLFCLIGSYTVSNNVTDMIIMMIFGLVGYLMKKFDYEAAPLILALVLCPMMEKAFRRSLMLSDGGFGIFLTRPISATFLILALLILLSPLFLKRKDFHEICGFDNGY
jgi:hypothetical protein